MTSIQLSIYAMAVGFSELTGILAWRPLLHNRAFFAFICVITVLFTCDRLMAHTAKKPLANWHYGQ